MKARSLRPTPIRLVAGAVLLSLAAALAQPAAAAPFGPHGHHGGPGGPDAALMGGMPGARMLDSVNATAEQKAQIQQIMQAARTDLRAQHEAGRALREQMHALFTQPTVDARAVEALRQQMLAQHDQASKRMTQAMLDASRVLTAEQRQQIAERMQQRRTMMERHRAERRALEGAPGAR